MRARRMGGISASVVAFSLVPAALAATPLDRFIARAGEEPGFVPQGQPQTVSTARAWVAGEPRRQRKADTARLRREGFVRAVSQQMTYTRSPNNGGGLSFVVELGSASAARAEQRVQLRQTIAAQGKATISRYTIPGIPGAQGFTATLSGQPGGASNALFTEGRCLLLVGDSVPSGNIGGPVRMAVSAIFRRTGGRCP
jgi:hypothetical protein